DCIACSVMPTAAQSMAVATQNKITRSCALSVVVSFSMTSLSLTARARISGGVVRQPSFGFPALTQRHRICPRFLPLFHPLHPKLHGVRRRQRVCVCPTAGRADAGQGL